MIAIAKARGLRTVNLVRRPEFIDELKKYGDGANIVVLDNENAPGGPASNRWRRYQAGTVRSKRCSHCPPRKIACTARQAR